MKHTIKTSNSRMPYEPEMRRAGFWSTLYACGTGALGGVIVVGLITPILIYGFWLWVTKK